jgi:redox-sensitive bicupin YhaK (pirin superfamily)
MEENMSEYAEIRIKISAREMAEGAGARVRRVFPTPQLDHLDPFVLLDEFYVTPPASFPDHEHRGFEALTYMLEGAFHHRDNVGNDSIVKTGGVQRFSAGKGIVHAELPGTSHLNHGLQLWINLPRTLKGMDPDYQQVGAAAIPEQKVKGMSIRTIVGESSPVQLHTPVRYLIVSLGRSSVFEEQMHPEWNTLVYVPENQIILNGTEISSGQAVVLEPGGIVKAGSSQQARMILVSGRPHNEPIRLRGSFVE